MKKLLFVALSGLFLAACGGASEQNSENKVATKATLDITIKGSDTVLPLTQKEAESFMIKNPEASITVVGGGSGVGIAAFKEGNTDIAMASRPMKLGEKIELEESGKAFTEKIIAYDALAIVVHADNKVNQLTREQLEAIFTGKVKNWKEVGGDDMKIVAYSRESSSGTHDFFKKVVNNKKEFGAEILLMPATGAIIQSVTQTKGAIGYVGLAYLEKTVKALSVSYDQGATFVVPSAETAEDKTYPITRPLFYYYLNSKESAVKPFLDYIFSEEGQNIVSKVGYIPAAMGK
ncbi:MAG: phosphate transport system substrate-binding protein [Sphingobacteriales bacterium]|jgi:phosphate transport system substrate-binding protein